MARFWMGIKTRAIPLIPAPILVPIRTGHIPILAQLMDRAYQGTVDHEGETLEQCAEEMSATIGGKYGSFITQASHLILENDLAASACLVTRWKEKPLIAFSMTDPTFQRRGLSQLLINAAIGALASLGEPDLFLVVTDGNTSAQNLYAKIGFKNLGIAPPGTPPPSLT